MSDKVKVTFTNDQKRAYKVVKKLYRKVPESERRPLEFDEIEKVLDAKEYFKFVTTIGTLGDSSRDQTKVFRHFINFKGLEPAAAAEQILTNKLDSIVLDLGIKGVFTYKDFVQEYKNVKGKLLVKANDYRKQIWTTFVLANDITGLIDDSKKLIKLKQVANIIERDNSKTAAYEIVENYIDAGKKFVFEGAEQITGRQLQWVREYGNRGYKMIDGSLSIVGKRTRLLVQLKSKYLKCKI